MDNGRGDATKKVEITKKESEVKWGWQNEKKLVPAKSWSTSKKSNQLFVDKMT